MIWPLRRTRRTTAAPAAPDPMPVADGRAHATGDAAWSRAAPLRTTGSAVHAPTIAAPPLAAPAGGLVQTPLRPVPAPSAAQRPAGTITGIVGVRRHPSSPRPVPEPPLTEGSALPAPPAKRRARSVDAAPATAPLVRADGPYVGPPRPAAPVEPSPPWMRGIVPGMSMEQVSAMFGDAAASLASRSGTPVPAAPAAATRPGPAGPAGGPGHAPRPRPSLAESRRQAAVDPPGREAPPAAATAPATPAQPRRSDPATPDGPGAASVSGPAAAPDASSPAPVRGGPAFPAPSAPTGGAAHTSHPLGLRPPLAHGPSARRPAVPDAAGEGERPRDRAPQGPAPPVAGPAPTAVVPRDMASAFALLYGVDVSAIPVHRGRGAAERASGMAARAFTEQGVVFLPEEAGPMEDRRVRGLLAHELTHAVQQRRHGSALPAENTASGIEMERQAVAAEQHFREEPGAPAPEPLAAACEHPAATEAAVRSISWTPDGGMVGGGVQRASTSEITRKFFDELNELRSELGDSRRVSSVSELDREQRIALELRLRKAGATEDEDEGAGQVPKRPLDWAEVFAQSASSLTGDALRPFYSRTKEEQRKSRDEWRRWALGSSSDADQAHAYADHLDAEEDHGGESGERRATPPGPTGEGGSPSLPGTGATDDLYARIVARLETDGLLPPGSGARASGRTGPPETAAAFPGTAFAALGAGAPAGPLPPVGVAPGAPGAPMPSPAPGTPGPGPSGVRPDAPKEIGGAASRPLDHAEVFAQTASVVASDLLRPFYSRSKEETARSRDEWRELALGLRHQRATAAERALLDQDDTRTPSPTAAAVVAAAAAQPTAALLAPAPAAPAHPTLAQLADQWDEVSLRVLSGRLYPLLIDSIRQDLMSGQQRHGIP
ncbi:DUF4157 domain-containing protein [Streptomyces sp. NPDC098789]|uniref:eCIS core domain-containing protein n=1 Tax=Streptomyces sp. NPDC098789 TaxID=3366098 RepID=UPI00382B1DF4